MMYDPLAAQLIAQGMFMNGEPPENKEEPPARKGCFPGGRLLFRFAKRKNDALRQRFRFRWFRFKS
jgi:hypothetical protein